MRDAYAGQEKESKRKLRWQRGITLIDIYMHMRTYVYRVSEIKRRPQRYTQRQISQIKKDITRAI